MVVLFSTSPNCHFCTTWGNKKMCLCNVLQSGRQTTHETSPLCHITCDDGNVYNVLASIRGKLIEVNERLLSDPQLLVHKVHLFLSLLILLYVSNIDHVVLQYCWNSGTSQWPKWLIANFQRCLMFMRLRRWAGETCKKRLKTKTRRFGVIVSC